MNSKGRYQTTPASGTVDQTTCRWRSSSGPDQNHGANLANLVSILAPNFRIVIIIVVIVPPETAQVPQGKSCTRPRLYNTE
jgi:hypothetical protein